MSTSSNKGLQEEEVLVLSSIFGDDFAASPDGRGGSVKVRPLDSQLTVHCELVFEFGESYPSLGPPSRIEVVCRDHSLPKAGVAAMTRAAVSAAERYSHEDGLPAISRIVEALKDTLRIADTAVVNKMPQLDQVRLLELASEFAPSAESTFAGSFFSLVPPDVMMRIFESLDGRSLGRCACVCNLWRRLVDNRDLWLAAFSRDFSNKFAGHWRKRANADPRAASADAWKRRIAKWAIRARHEIEERVEEEQKAETLKTKAVTVNPFALRPPAAEYYKPTTWVPFNGAPVTDGKEDKQPKPKAKKEKRKRKPLCGRRYYNS